MDIHPIDTHITAIDHDLLGLPGVGVTYVVRGEDIALVETGTSLTVPATLAGLEKLGIAREAVGHILCTHVHMDHAGGGWLSGGCAAAGHCVYSLHDDGAFDRPVKTDAGCAAGGGRRGMGVDGRYFAHTTRAVASSRRSPPRPGAGCAPGSSGNTRPFTRPPLLLGAQKRRHVSGGCGRAIYAHARPAFPRHAGCLPTTWKLIAIPSPCCGNRILPASISPTGGHTMMWNTACGRARRSWMSWLRSCSRLSSGVKMMSAPWQASGSAIRMMGQPRWWREAGAI